MGERDVRPTRGVDEGATGLPVGLHMRRHLLRGAWLLGCVGMMAGAAWASSKTLVELVDQLGGTIATYAALSRPMGGYDVVFRRDPMRRLIDEKGDQATASGLHGGLSVQGIIWSQDHPLVVVDDELFQAGDVLGSYTILRVYSAGIVVQHGKQALFIPLDRGLETPAEQPVDPLLLLSLPEYVPPPYALRRATPVIPMQQPVETPAPVVVAAPVAAAEAAPHVVSAAAPETSAPVVAAAEPAPPREASAVVELSVVVQPPSAAVDAQPSTPASVPPIAAPLELSPDPSASSPPALPSDPLDRSR